MSIESNNPQPTPPNMGGPTGGGPSGPPQAPEPVHPLGQPPQPRHLSVWMRLVRSKRVRIFFVVAVALHLAAAILISSSRTVRDWLFSEHEDARPVELTQREIDDALQTLNGIYRARFEQSLLSLQSMRSRLDAVQRRRLEQLRGEDREREEAIAAGRWPTAAEPNLQARYFARIDVDPPAIPLDPLPGDLRPLDLVDIYKLHEPLEQDMGRLYERFHALELSRSLESPSPLSRSLENTRLQRPPQRRTVDQGFAQRARREVRITSNQQFDQYKRELTDLYLETLDMVKTTENWLAQAEQGEGGGVLAALFGQQVNVVPPPEPYYGHYLNPRLLRQVSMQSLVNPRVGLGTRIGETELTHIRDQQPIDPSDPNRRPGYEWISLDRWYYIGPFPHPGRERRLADLEHRYGPEESLTNINLDRVYQGRDGREIRWKYRRIGNSPVLGQAPNRGLEIMPFTVDNTSYAIWYFYTEVWSDRDMTVVGSFASDDYGVAWVNGQRVWQSPPETQPWVPFNEYGFAPVQLRRGFNQVFFKLENALGTTGFSVILQTYENRPLLEALERDMGRR